MTLNRSHFVDTHCHIDLFQDPEEVAQETESHQIHTIAVTNTPSVYPYTESITERLRYIRPAVGLHPELATTRRDELPLMWELLERTRYVGEIGLDYKTADELERKTQRDLFDSILARCADFGNKIITIHSRRAAQDVITAIGENYPGKVILHWYSGPVGELERAIRYGFYFSVNSAMIRTRKGRSLIQRMPRNRILTETDGPFARISNEPSRPRHVSLIVAALGKLWKVHQGLAEQEILGNFRSLLE